jgi:hypothetical protein
MILTVLLALLSERGPPKTGPASADARLMQP